MALLKRVGLCIRLSLCRFNKIETINIPYIFINQPQKCLASIATPRLISARNTAPNALPSRFAHSAIATRRRSVHFAPS